VIAALYVQKDGCYYGLTDVEPWDESMDARKYDGPFPVVAHPPCQLWTNMAHLNFKRYGGEHNRPGNDGGCFSAALLAVRRYGGVLEHPASSAAWSAHSLPRPSRGRWYATKLSPREWVTEVNQAAYGHLARKRTWLLCVSDREPMPLDWRDIEGTHQCGWFDRIKPTLGKLEASATPLPFRDLLLNIVGACHD
jgi:hypothetical protein